MQYEQTAINCSIIRGGTSRGVYFLASDLPRDTASRERILLAALGGPDALQIDGLGGGHPLTSKVAIVGPGTRPDADIDYLFLQISPHTQEVSSVQNCGNILAGVGSFALDQGLVSAEDGETVISVHMLNSGNMCALTLLTPRGNITYEGATAIDGVPGTGAPVVCDFLDVAGSATGAMLPTGNIVDSVGGVEVTCVDNGMPIIVMRAADVGIGGTETTTQLNTDAVLKRRLEAIRTELGSKMNLGDVRAKTVPKMCLISAPTAGGSISTRTFIPHVCHESIGVLGAVSVATACLLPDSVASGLAVIPAGEEKLMSIEHPSGSLSVKLVVNEGASAVALIKRAGIVRTARLIMQGRVHVPASII